MIEIEMVNSIEGDDCIDAGISEGEVVSTDAAVVNILRRESATHTCPAFRNHGGGIVTAKESKITLESSRNDIRISSSPTADIDEIDWTTAAG